jgi:hypothetical protein
MLFPLNTFPSERIPGKAEVARPRNTLPGAREQDLPRRNHLSRLSSPRGSQLAGPDNSPKI